MKICFVYSGQGAQKVGMGKDFYDQNEIFRSAFDLLTDRQKSIAFDGSAEELAKTANTQPIMTAFAVGITDMLSSAGVHPEVAFGLSLGEYSALYSADVFGKEQVIELICFRAGEMTKASQGRACKMAAILMLSVEKIAECCEKASEFGIVSMANFNCPGQVVISGDEKAVEAAAELCLVSGAKRAVFLDTEGAFHTSVMEDAYVSLKNRFLNEKFNFSSVPVIMNNLARVPENLEELKENLALQVKSSVRFEESVRTAVSMGVDTFVEIGMGKTLCGFIKKIAPNATLYNIESVEGYEGFLEEVNS